MKILYRHIYLSVVLISACCASFAQESIVIKVIEQEQISLHVSQQSIRQILIELKKWRHFSISGELTAQDRETPVDFSAAGDLTLVLERLLKNYNHIFSYNSDRTISQVVILGKADSDNDSTDIATSKETTSNTSNSYDDDSPFEPGTEVSADATANSNEATPSPDLPDSEDLLADVPALAQDNQQIGTPGSTNQQIARILSGNQFQPVATAPLPSTGKSEFTSPTPATTSQITEPGLQPHPQSQALEITPQLQEQVRILTQQAKANIKALVEQLKKNEQALKNNESDAPI